MRGTRSFIYLPFAQVETNLLEKGYFTNSFPKTLIFILRELRALRGE